jgi:HYR domain
VESIFRVPWGSVQLDDVHEFLATAEAKRVRVRYAVMAKDAKDGLVRANCTPRSGSFFRRGRTTVRCSAADSSGNTTKATFVVTVKR